MTTIKPSTDRRRSMRFSVRDGIVYLDKAKYFPRPLYRFEPASTISSLHMKIGDLVNISEGGLSFQYFSANGEIENLDIYTMSVDLRESDIEIKKLMFNTKNDFAVSDNSLGLRQRCVQFGRIQSDESSCLMSFLENCQLKTHAMI